MKIGTMEFDRPVMLAPMAGGYRPPLQAYLQGDGL